MKDRKLRSELQRLGIIQIDYNNYNIEELDKYMKFRELNHKVNLILEHLGLEYKTNNRLEKTDEAKQVG